MQYVICVCDVLCNSKVLGGAKGSILLILAVVLLSCMGESLYEMKY